MKTYSQFIAENKGKTFDPRYHYAVYTHSRISGGHITGPYKSEASAYDDHGGDMDEIHKGDKIQHLMNKGMYKDYTHKFYHKPV